MDFASHKRLLRQIRHGEFSGCEAGRYSVIPILKRAMREHIVTGERFDGPWNDIGTLERLEQAEASL